MIGKNCLSSYFTLFSHFPLSPKPTSLYFPPPLCFSLCPFHSFISPAPLFSFSTHNWSSFSIFLLTFFLYFPLIPNCHPALITFSNHKILLLDEFRFHLKFQSVVSWIPTKERFRRFSIFERNKFVLTIFYIVSAA